MVAQDQLKQQKTLILSASDVQQTIAEVGLNAIMDQLIARLNAAIGNLDPEKTKIPPRSGFHYYEPAMGLVEWMPIFNHGQHVTIKVVGYHPYNPLLHNLPTILSTISAYDTATGHLVGIMDGVVPTALRTGAASAVASKLLARPDSQTVGLIGCGAQAVTQLHALSRVFDLKNVYVYDVSAPTMFSFKDRRRALRGGFNIIESDIETIVAVSDILCTATSIDVGQGPLFANLPTQPHLHINAVGADFPGKVELPYDLLADSFVCPDFRSQAVVEGECQQLKDSEIGADLEEVVRNPAKYQHIQNQKSVFDSTGWALEDQVIMELFMEYAFELDLGKYMEIETITSDSKNPYHFLTNQVAYAAKV